MKITKIEQLQLSLPFITPFKTSYGEITEKVFDLYLVHDEQGNIGFGELDALENPDYIEETLLGERQIIEKHLVCQLLKQTIGHPREIQPLFASVQGHYMAKSALETAVWDLYAKREKKPLAVLFQQNFASHIPVGISLGIQSSLDQLEKVVQHAVEEGYKRVKLKIQPGYDFEPLRFLRDRFPNLCLMADANSAYTSEDIEHLKKLDVLDLVMIEQPFDQRDYVTHAQLQTNMTTRICLDENIRCLEDVKTAVALNSCQAINLKIPRVGGIQSALDIMKFCNEHQLLVWLGGMYESGVGRALNLQFASQSSFTFPGDISASDRYFEEDIVGERARLIDGKIIVPKGDGLGVTLDEAMIEKYLLKKQTF